MPFVRALRPFVACLAVTLCAACSRSQPDRVATQPAPERAPTPLDVVLAPQGGDHPLDRQIERLQKRIPGSLVRLEEIEQLGWTYIARARELEDPGAYNLALQCALAIDSEKPGSHAALLLRGHALHSLHRFAEAEQVARKLVAQRGLPFDYGLLGDVLIDRGQIAQAIEAYQRMVDERPDMHSYARAAHVRYLTGDLPGALAAMEMAARAASPRNRESFAWTWARLAQYQWQAGASDDARDSAERALSVQPDSVPALKIAALIRLARGEQEGALAALRKAAVSSSHPELLWLLAETLEQVGQGEQAGAVRARLNASGAAEDARGYALYLASRAEQLPLAERLAQAELAERPDSYSYEALALVQSARSEHASALQNARRSLAAGTKDARLYYHAGLVAERAGDQALAQAWLAQARSAPALLFPSQRAGLLARSAAR